MYPQVFGKYVLERELARGGMARVCLATLRGASGFEKKLVVKQIRDELALDDEFVRRFVEEAKTTVALSHPNIVPVYELGVEQGTYFLAMELVDGVSVTELLADGATQRPLSPEQAAYVGVEICRALDYAHRRMQVVHRDITPRNVMVDDEGQVKLIDFGIAARVRAAGEVFGSPGHMPPEQMKGGALLGPETDLFAVAALLLEAWSGKAPFRRKALEDCEAAMRAPHPRPSDGDPRLMPLDDAIAAALALDPTARTASADELGRALRKFLQGVDLGDVARSLGDRARLAREHLLVAPEPPDSVRDLATALSPVTRTFAERDELKTLSDGAPTLATRPLETRGRPIVRADPPPRARGRALAGAAALVLLASGVAVLRHRDERLPATDFPPHEALPSSVRGVVLPVVPAVVSAVEPSVTAPPVTRTQAEVVPLPSKPALVKGSTARIALYGDPGTTVLVDGIARGPCPVKDLELAAGPHQLRFVFEPTHEVRDEQIKLSPGDHIALRADFTGTSPTIRVER